MVNLKFRPTFLLALIIFAFLPAYADDIPVRLDDDEGLLLIDVRVQFVSDINHDSGKDTSRRLTFDGADSFAVKNLVTGKTYGGMVTGSHQDGLQVITLPEGFYCLDSIRFSIEISYCGEPFLKVEKHKINNAGKWRFGFSNDGSRLRGSMEKIEETSNLAKQKFPEYFINLPQ